MELKYKIKNSFLRGLLATATMAAIDSVSQADILPETSYLPGLGTSVCIDNGNILAGQSFGLMPQGEQGGLAHYFYESEKEPAFTLYSYSSNENDGQFGTSVDLSGVTALVGAPMENKAYYYHNISGRTGLVSETYALIQPEWMGVAATDRFGSAVSIGVNSTTGDKSALVGAPGYDSGSGAFYYYWHLHSETGNTTTPVTGMQLMVRDASDIRSLGSAVCTDGNNGLVGAPDSDTNGAVASGAAFFYYQLEGKYKVGLGENAKLVASDPSQDAHFGAAVSLSELSAVVGAPGANTAYLFRDLPASSTEETIRMEDLMLVTNDYNIGGLGTSVSLVDDSVLVGAPYSIKANKGCGAVLYYSNLTGKSGFVGEDVILYPSSPWTGMAFGSSVALDANKKFAIGDPASGRVYRGNIGTFTKLDIGYANEATNGISSILKSVWQIGGTTNNNTVTVSAGDSVDANEYSIVIGGNNSNDNTLIIEGSIAGLGNVYIGDADNSTGNTLVIENPYSYTVAWMALCTGSKLKLKNFYPSLGDLVSWVNNGTLVARSNETDNYEAVTYVNCESLLEISFDGTYAVVSSRYNPGQTPERPTLGEPSISGGTVTINALGKAGNYYALYASPNLLGEVSSWTKVTGATGQIATDGTATISFPKSAAGGEFYRMVTSASPYTASLNADSAYSTNVVGRYDVTIPAGKKMLVGRQLSGTQNKVSQLFTALPRSSTVTVSKNGQFEETERHRITGAWSSDAYTLEVGEAAQVYNAGTSAVTITFTGEVLTAKAFNMGAGKYSYACSIVPVALTSPENMGYVRGKEDVVNKYENDVYVGYGVHRITGQWSSGAPSFKVGEGMLFQLKTAQQWTEKVSVDASSLKVSRTQ